MIYTIKSGLYQETLVLASISMMITKIYIYLVGNKLSKFIIQVHCGSITRFLVHTVYNVSGIQ